MAVTSKFLVSGGNERLVFGNQIDRENFRTRPPATARRFRKPATWATAELRNLPSGRFTQLGRSGPWGVGPYQAGMGRLAAVQAQLALNGGYGES